MDLYELYEDRVALLICLADAFLARIIFFSYMSVSLSTFLSRMSCLSVIEIGLLTCISL